MFENVPIEQPWSSSACLPNLRTGARIVTRQCHRNGIAVDLRAVVNEGKGSANFDRCARYMRMKRRKTGLAAWHAAVQVSLVRTYAKIHLPCPWPHRRDAGGRCRAQHLYPRGRRLEIQRPEHVLPTMGGFGFERIPRHPRELVPQIVRKARGEIVARRLAGSSIVSESTSSAKASSTRLTRASR
jgi:hypothetical protein